MRVDEKATKAARVAHARGVARLNELFLFDPAKPSKPRHDARWRGRPRLHLGGGTADVHA